MYCMYDSKINKRREEKRRRRRRNDSGGQKEDAVSTVNTASIRWG